MSLEVLHLSTEPTLRGGERQLLLLHEGLLERGLASHLLCRAGGELEAHATRERSALTWYGLAGLGGLAPALLHCHDSKAFTLGSIIGRLRAVPVIVTRRVVFPVRASAFNRWKYRRASRVIAVSAAAASRVEAIAARDKVSVVHDGVSWDAPALTREQARSELGLAAHDIVAGTVGFFSREKNVELIFDLAEKLPAVRFVCLGPMEPAAARRARSIAGLVAPGAVRDARTYYRAFDLYVSTSTLEGLGTALLDAVVRDIPAIARDALGNREIYPEGSPWLASDPNALAEAIREVAAGLPAAREIARRYGERARGIFDVARMIEGNVAVYREMLGRS